MQGREGRGESGAGLGRFRAAPAQGQGQRSQASASASLGLKGRLIRGPGGHGVRMNTNCVKRSIRERPGC